MIKYSLFPTLLLFSLLVFAQDEFLSKHPKGMPGFKSAQGKKEWQTLLAEFKNTGDIRLVSLALNSPPETGILHGEKSLLIFDMLKARPEDFMKADEKQIKNFSCILYYLIPATQFIPFSELDDVMKIKKDPNPFREKAKLYFKQLKDDKTPAASC